MTLEVTRWSSEFLEPEVSSHFFMMSESSFSCRATSSLAKDFLISLIVGCKPWGAKITKN
jgi:hypothetical protein